MRREKTFTEQQRTIGALLRVPYQHLSQEVYEELTRSGYGEVRQAHSVIFRHILPSGSRITELAESAGITKQSMATLVEHLQHHGYLTVQADPRDGRAKRVMLTKRGKEVQREAMRLSQKVEQQWASLLGKEKMEMLRMLLDELYQHLEGERRE